MVLFDKLWAAKAPLKVKIFGWLALKGRIRTMDNLSTRGWIGDEMCVFCQANIETVDHLLVRCPAATALLEAQLIYRRLLNGCIAAVNLWESLSQLGGCHGRRERGILLASWWSIWLERNSRIFENKRVNRKHLLESAHALRSLWESFC